MESIDEMRSKQLALLNEARAISERIERDSKKKAFAERKAHIESKGTKVVLVETQGERKGEEYEGFTKVPEMVFSFIENNKAKEMKVSPDKVYVKCQGFRLKSAWASLKVKA